MIWKINQRRKKKKKKKKINFYMKRESTIQEKILTKEKALWK